jgi:quercetin dioxygenase-like cupin family protein
MAPYSPFYAAENMVEIGRVGKVSYRMVGINHPNRQILMLHETYAVGSESGNPFAHTAQEAGIVTRGAVELTVGDETQVLRTGDGYYFDSRTPHRFRNRAPSDGREHSSVDAQVDSCDVSRERTGEESDRVGDFVQLADPACWHLGKQR